MKLPLGIGPTLFLLWAAAAPQSAAQVSAGGGPGAAPAAPASPAPQAPSAPPAARPPGVPAVGAPVTPPTPPGGGVSPSTPWVGKKTGRGAPYSVGKKRPRWAIDEDADPEATVGLPVAPVPAKEPTIIIDLGDSVRGSVERDLEHAIRFAAVDGTRISLELATEEGSRAVTARLIDPNGVVVKDLLPETPEATRSAVAGVPIEKTGVYTVRVSFDRKFAVPYLLTTTAEFPSHVDTEVDLKGGRPICLPLGGMTGRKLKSAVVNRRGEADLELVAQLLAPDGQYVPLGDHATPSWDGERWTLTNFSLEQNDDYLLYVVDKNRTTGRVKVSLTYENAPLGRRLHEVR